MTLHLLFMALFGILVGVGASFTGLGGGFLMVPVLLFVGYSAQKAVGTSFLAILVISISALVAQEAFGALKAPIKMVTPPHTPVPFSPQLEDAYIPNPAKIEAAVRAVAEAK